jgi:hypothetical protein
MTNEAAFDRQATDAIGSGEQNELGLSPQSIVFAASPLNNFNRLGRASELALPSLNQLFERLLPHS